jgi:TonB family protein
MFKLIALVPIVAVALVVNAEIVEDVVYAQPQQQIVKKGKVNKTVKMGNRSLVVVEDKAQTEAQKSVEMQSAGDNDKVFDVVEEMPQFPGGQAKLLEYLLKSVRYPAEAEKAGLQGRVVVTFVVEKDGSITNVEVRKGIAPSLDAEALRVINAMPNWTSGKQGGKPVCVKYAVPVSFRLQGSNDATVTQKADDDAKGTHKLNDIVVVGYSPQKENSLAYKIGYVSAKNGVGSDSQPYILVDGKPVSLEETKNIDTNAIDYIEVLKDKASIEKYGEKAKNGVVLISTKK